MARCVVLVYKTRECGRRQCVFYKNNTLHVVNAVQMFVLCRDPVASSSLSTMRFGGINTLRPRRHFADDTFKHIFLNENVRILIKISLKFVPKSPINNIPSLVQVMAWRRPGDKPLSESMMVRSLTHICVTRPQWVNPSIPRVGWLRPRR